MGLTSLHRAGQRQQAGLGGTHGKKGPGMPQGRERALSSWVQGPTRPQTTDCGKPGLGEEAEGSEQSPSPTQLFPWMRPQGELASGAGEGRGRKGDPGPRTGRGPGRPGSRVPSSWKTCSLRFR